MTDTRSQIEHARHGDEDAIHALLTRHVPRLRAYLRLQLGERALARESVSDFVQSVCRECLVDADKFEYRNEAGFRQWLFTIALRKIADRARYWTAKKRDVGLEQAAESGGAGSDAGLGGAVFATLFTPSRDAAVREQVERIHAAFQGLTETQREFVTMARIYGYTYREIGEQSGRTEDAVRMTVARALVKLSTLLDD